MRSGRSDNPKRSRATAARRPRKLQRVVALGGGTGLPVVLRALRRHLPPKCRITAVVTSADDGGSSGILRKEYGVLPPGDIRNCLVALARVAPEVTAALQCRLTTTSSTEHAVGNLLLTALDLVASDEIAAIRLAATLLGIDDVVLPSTTTRAHLVARLVDGRLIRGESAIRQSGAPIVRLSIDPPDAAPASGVIAAIEAADAIVVGPGSFYTSVLATLVVPGIAEAIVASDGLKIFVCNLMMEPGETEDYDVADHLRALSVHGLPAHALDYVILNNGEMRGEVVARYKTAGAGPVRPDFTLSSGRPRFVSAALVESGPIPRHDSEKLGPLLCALGARRRTNTATPVGPSSRRGSTKVTAIPLPLTA
jgi:uncharacterized cofD-like protein